MQVEKTNKCIVTSSRNEGRIYCLHLHWKLSPMLLQTQTNIPVSPNSNPFISDHILQLVNTVFRECQPAVAEKRTSNTGNGGPTMGDCLFLTPLTPKRQKWPSQCQPGCFSESSKVQYWQLIDIPRLISSYCFYKDIWPSPNLYPNLLQLPILQPYVRIAVSNWKRSNRPNKAEINTSSENGSNKTTFVL